jgi:5-methylcytosine-specific restriction endonuclease McrA
MRYIRIGKFSLDEVLDFIGPFQKVYMDKIVKMGSHRYQLFKNKGTTCVKCGLKGEFFALEKQEQKHTVKGKELPDSDKYHFNLYGYDENGNEVMLTKDHILPRSKGGENELRNYQTLCYNCNWEKADKYEEGEINREIGVSGETE